MPPPSSSSTSSIVTITGRHASVVIYLWMIVFGVMQSVSLSPLVVTVHEQVNYVGLSIWLGMISVGSVLAALGAWVAPLRAWRGRSPLSAQVLEVLGAVLLTFAFLGFHITLVLARGWSATPFSQVQIASWWTFTLARAVQVTVEAVKAQRARRRGTAVRATLLGDAPPGG